jgi:hypothetical protein
VKRIPTRAGPERGNDPVKASNLVYTRCHRGHQGCKILHRPQGGQEYQHSQPWHALFDQKGNKVVESLVSSFGMPAGARNTRRKARLFSSFFFILRRVPKLRFAFFYRFLMNIIFIVFFVSRCVVAIV